MKFNYQNDLEKVKQFSLKKFKSGVSVAIEDIYITIQKNPKQASILYLMVRNSGTKLTVYQGILMKNITIPENFMGKLDNCKFEVVKKNRSEAGEKKQSQQESPKMVKEIVKLQFGNQQECE